MKYFFLFVFTIFFMVSCKDKTKNSAQTMLTGEVKILVDESFAPIIEDQQLVFQSSYQQAKLDLLFKPEIDLLNLFLQDSIKVAILSRDISPKEAMMYEKKNVLVRRNKIATDAVALITHKTSKDTSITVDELILIMRGQEKGKNLVFDNPNSSTVRYLKDLAGIRDLPKNGVYALKSNVEVIQYVHNNPGTIGVIGVNWMRQPEKELIPVIEELKIMSVKNLAGKPGSDAFYSPSQNNLALGLYPLSRDLYIINCQGGSGLGTGFAAFLAGERGQRIILKSGLLPEKIPSREIFLR